MTLEETIRLIEQPDETAMTEAKARWDSIAKPLGSLGLLEDALIRIAGVTGSARIDLGKRGVAIFCADNGVVEEGVTQTGSEVTAIVTENFTKGATSVCAMARAARCDVLPVDIGVAREVSGPGLRVHKVRPGTANMAKGPAMRREEAVDAIEYGIRFAGELGARGYRILATGEMGIGNTTTSSAVTSVLLDAPVELVTGRGAGLSGAGLRRKADAIRRGVALNRPDPADPVDVLAKVGGLDLAGLTGFFLGCAVSHVPVLLDGFISAAAALAAARLCPAAAGAMLASHRSDEPGGKLLLEALGLRAPIDARMCLGEGTGAVAALPLLDMACAVYREMSTFGDIAVDAYQPLD